MSEQPFDESYEPKPPVNYERYFVPAIGKPVARDLISTADLKPGQQVLDVACGTGIVARLALPLVGEAGSVTGLDVNPGMLAVARSIAKDLAIDWHEAGAENMPFPDKSFDVVFCQMGLQFMEDKSAALQEMHRVLATGGHVYINVPGPAGIPFAVFAEAMDRNIGPETGGFVKQVFALNDNKEIHDLIKDSGFTDVEVQAKNMTFSLPAPKDFLWQYISSTPLVEVLAGADNNAKASLEQEVVGAWQNFVNDGTFKYEQRIVLASARK